MKRIAIVAAAAAVGGATAPGPVANYWMDVATTSGMGAGMMGGGGQPNMAQIMQMMQGGGGEVGHTVNLYLASKQKPAGAPQAQHLIPPGMQMGPSLPLIGPTAAKPVPQTSGLPQNFQRPQGRMLIYWGCGEHAGAGQPTVVDFANMAAGKMPPGFAAMAQAMQAAQPPRAGQSAGFGEWPNTKDSRPVPSRASLLGAHKVEGNYSPPIAFSLAAGQDFMPGLGLREAGALPSGAIRLMWTPAAQATGYALAMFGASPSGDVLVWTSASKAAAFPNMDYLSPSQVKKLVASGGALAPSTGQCTVPAEVIKASPAGMVTMIGYGPEAHFSDKPKAPTWTVRARYKTTASLMLGMGDMFGAAQSQQPVPQQPQKRKKGFGLGDLIKAIPGQ
jgi:hypothetical protein